VGGKPRTELGKEVVSKVEQKETSRQTNEKKEGSARKAKRKRKN